MAVASVGAHPAPKPVPAKATHPRPQPPTASLSGQNSQKAHPLIGKSGHHVNKLV
jgi:hypothetical protein